MNWITIIDRIAAFVTGKTKYSKLLHCLIITILGLLAYSNTFRSSFSFDDVDNIHLNEFIRNVSAPGSYSFFLDSRRGIGFLSFLLNYRLGGLDVSGYHLVNLAIHISTAMLVYGLVLTTARASLDNNQGDQNTIKPEAVAFLTSFLFVAHPVQTQAVTYIVQRFTSLCAMFYVAGILCYALARQTVSDQALKGQQSRHPKAWGFLALSLLCAALAAKTKEIAYTFPVIVLVYEFMFFRSPLQQRLKYLLLPVAAPFALAGMMIFRVLHDDDLHGIHELTRIETNISRIDYLFTQFRVIMTYIRLLFFPINQSIDYDYSVSTAFTGQVALSALALGMLLLTAVWLWIRSNRLPPSPDTLYLRLIAFGIIWFFVTLSIESSIIPIVDVIFEHRLYLPSAGALVAITAAIMCAADKLGQLPYARLLATFTLLTVALALAIATYKRNAVWSDELTLWQDAYLKAPRKARVVNNYAAALILRGKAETALPLLIEAIEISPGYFATWNNLPRVFGQMPLLRGHYWNGFEMVGPNGDVNPAMVTKWYSNALNNLGLAYQLQNNVPKAFDCYRKSLEINPSFSLTRENAMLLLSTLPDKAQAASYLEQLRRMPSQ